MITIASANVASPFIAAVYCMAITFKKYVMWYLYHSHGNTMAVSLMTFFSPLHCVAAAGLHQNVIGSRSVNLRNLQSLAWQILTKRRKIVVAR